MSRRLGLKTGALLLALALGPSFGGCSGGGALTGDGGRGGAGGSARGGGGGVTTGGGGQGAAAPGCVPISCGAEGLLACGDCLDNDGDGLVDMDDPECAGPCDGSEDSFNVLQVGECNCDACRSDCLFDSNGGSGDDQCEWTTRCDPLEVAPAYDPMGPSCASTATTSCGAYAAQSDQCRAFCLPVVPNGCDCFGCCELPARSGHFVWLNSKDDSYMYTCVSAADEADPTRCRPCTPVTSCLNACESCELCIGETALPAGCATPSCPPNVQPCGLPDLSRCPAGAACISGCCETASWFAVP